MGLQVYSTLRTTTHLHTYYVTSHISFKIFQDIVTNVTPLDYVGIGIVSERVVCRLAQPHQHFLTAP